MPEYTMKGNRTGETGRRPRTYAEDRVCAHRGCSTKLSRYNRRDLCYVHSPLRFPRTRGRVVPAE